MADLAYLTDAPPALPVTARAIGPLRIVTATPQIAVDQIVATCARGTGSIFGFCNTHTVNMARADADFAAALDHITLFNDGIGIDIASRILHGAPFPANLNGTDLSPMVLAALPDATAVFLVGSAPGVVARARACLSHRFAHLRFVGEENGFFAPADEADLAARIRASGARVVLVGMGHPRQELWAARTVPTLDATILCIGAFLDFSAGTVSRAPRWVRVARLEWIFRFLLEPRRLARRYLIGNVSFLAYIVALRLRATRR